MSPHPDTPELNEILDKFAINVEVSRYGVKIGSRNIGQHVSALERYTTEAKASLTRLLAKRELEGRIDVWVQLINTLRFVIEHKRQETSEEAAKHWKEKAEEVLAELREELAKYEGEA